ncbi:MAG: hypothetical protein GY796_32745 [Chloroflexi bacterium]|nr:hypothetical protein [Chloroflexota bacterium]
MRWWRPLLFLIIILLLAVASFIFIRQRLQAANYGPQTALCPGPDFYGYVCEGGTAVAYINATQDTQLYELDGVTAVNLPFPFTFYGTTYNELFVSSNGNLQFSSNNPNYTNDCLDNGPAAEMGDMIAPYWDDFDLRFAGFLETELVGEEPNRVFVIEWDSVPRFDSGEPMTFEAQLFEGSNHIVFLYQNVLQSVDGNGRSATIGLQSEAQRLTLQYGCNQAVVANASQLQFTHPARPNGNVGLARPVAAPKFTAAATAKGDTAELIRQLNLHGELALADLRQQWLSQSPPLTADWERMDLNGDGRAELIILRRSVAQHPERTQLIVLSPDKSGQMGLRLDHTFSTRQQMIPQVEVEHIGDLTADGRPDILLFAPKSNHLFVLTADSNTITLLPLPDQCQGGLAIIDDQIVRDGCADDGRVIITWDGNQFTNIP